MAQIFFKILNILASKFFNLGSFDHKNMAISALFSKNVALFTGKKSRRFLALFGKIVGAYQFRSVGNTALCCGNWKLGNKLGK